MNNYKKILLATAFAVVSSSIAQAGTLTVINKVSDQGIHLCIRGEGSKAQAGKPNFQHFVKASAQKTYTVRKKHNRGGNTFEVLVAKGKDGHPEWELMGASCSNLVTDADHTIIVNSTLGKLSCQDVTAANPVSNR